MEETKQKLPQRLGITPEREKQISEELNPILHKAIDSLLEDGKINPDEILFEAVKVAQNINEGVLIGTLVAHNLIKIRQHAEGKGNPILQMILALKGAEKHAAKNREHQRQAANN